MTTQREQRKAQMAAAATRRTEPDARPPGRTAIRSKPVRITLDVPRVALADAVRAMIRVTIEDPDEVLERLRRDRER
jgi:hypothetical protein